MASVTQLIQFGHKENTSSASCLIDTATRASTQHTTQFSCVLYVYFLCKI